MSLDPSAEQSRPHSSVVAALGSDVVFCALSEHFLAAIDGGGWLRLLDAAAPHAVLQEYAPEAGSGKLARLWVQPSGTW